MIWDVVFYVTAAIMLITAAALLFVRQPMHAALYLVASLLALAVLFFMLGSPLVAVLQVILYVGAIIVLFLFLIMITNPHLKRESEPIIRRGWWWPTLLVVILFAELAVLLWLYLPDLTTAIHTLGPETVGLVLFGPYVLLVEAAAVLLLAALAAVLYLSRKREVSR